MVLTIFGEPKPSIDHLIEHIDGNPENDAISNLKWILPWSEEPFVDHTKEFWRRMDKIGYPNYCISSFSNLKNAINNRPMATYIDEEGYFVASIINSEGKHVKPYVHTLMALVFIGPRPSDKHSVDHINRERKDNIIGNLRWASPKEQAQNRTYKKNRPGISVYQYDLNMNFIKKWDSMSQARETYGYSYKYMKSVCVEKRSSQDGFIWKFADDVEIIPGEIWKPNPFSDCNEFVSNFGRIRGVRGFINHNWVIGGYVFTTYRCLGDKIPIRVHRLVLATFVKFSDMEINHIDGIKTNNHVSNLEYVSKSQNLQHAYQSGLIKNTYHKPVFKIIIANGKQITYPSISNAAESNCVSKGAMTYRCRNGIIIDGCKWGIISSPSDLQPEISASDSQSAIQPEISSSNSEPFNPQPFDPQPLIPKPLIPPSDTESLMLPSDSHDNLGENITLIKHKCTRDILMIDPVSRQIIMQFTSTDEIVSSFENINKKTIYSILRGELASYRGYQFVYQGDHIRDLRKLTTKTEQLTLDGDFVAIHDTTVLAAKVVSGNESNLAIARSSGKPYKSYLWRKIEVLDIHRQTKIKTLKLKSSAQIPNPQEI